jgi:opacity protein-like surface antigen
MKKLLLFVCCLPLMAAAQNFHFSARLGAAGYKGELKAKSISLSQMGLLGSLGARYDLSEHLSARTYFTLTSLRGDDKKGTSAMQQRNLNFKSSLFDWELTGQYNIFSLNERWWTPYLFAGIGLYHFKPFTEDSAGNKTFLKPLSTEGQGFTSGRDEYKLTQFSIPFGFGAEYSLNEDMRVGLEMGYRKVFTDYLDDVSTTYVDQSALFSARGPQAVDLAWRGDEVHNGPYPTAGTARGNADNKDGYYYIGLTFTMRFWFDKYKQTSGLPGGGRDKRMGCPGTRVR